MAVAVVDGLEVVEIDESQGHGIQAPSRPGQGLPEVDFEGVAVGKPGQLVVEGLVFEFFGGLHHVRHIAVDSHEFPDLPGAVVDGVDREEVPEGRSILPVEAGHFLEGLSRPKILEDPVDRFRVRLRTHQKEGCVPQHLLGGSPDHGSHGRIGIENLVVCVDHKDSFSHRIDGTGQPPLFGQPIETVEPF